MIASKAARIVQAAAGRAVYDFSLRRTHGADASIKVARSSYIAGFHGTSNVLAGKLYGIGLSGTMAHSFVMAFGSELEAFRAYASVLVNRRFYSLIHMIRLKVYAMQLSWGVKWLVRASGSWASG